MPENAAKAAACTVFLRGRIGAHGDAHAFAQGWEAAKADTLAAAEPREVEYGVRSDLSGAVLQGGPGWDHLVRSDPKDYPGFTLVTRMCGEWEPFTPSTERGES